MQDRETVALPRKPDKHSAATQAKVSILRVLEFNPETLKSGSVVLSEDTPPGSALLFVRGAANVIKHLVHLTSVPPDFDQVRHTLLMPTKFCNIRSLVCIACLTVLFQISAPMRA